jgi:lysine 2,3-aminomutase
MPQYIVDIPEGGGKAAMTPNFLIDQIEGKWSFQGWDGVRADYISPKMVKKPFVAQEYRRS